MAIGNLSFTSILSIPKLQGKAQYKKWRNEVQGFYEMNGMWGYMLREINKPASLSTLEESKVHDTLLKKANEAKIMR